jgi:hypothetical protein
MGEQTSRGSRAILNATYVYWITKTGEVFKAGFYVLSFSCESCNEDEASSDSCTDAMGAGTGECRSPSSLQLFVYVS